MTNVLLVYPWFPPSFWGFRKSMELLGLKATMPPTGLATLAAMLPVEHFRVLPIVDLNVEPLADQVIKRADLVMTTGMIVQRDSLRRLIAQVKRHGKTIIAGGPYATSYRQEVLAMGADSVVLGEAELTLPRFIEDWLNGRLARVYDEQSVRACSTVALTREGKPVITGTPVPRWDLLKLRCYSSLPVQFSRGCPFDCDFCDITTLFGHISRTKTPAQLIAELEAIRQTGWRGSVFVVDDNFIGNRQEVRELLPELVKWQKRHHYPFSFFTEASMDLANPSLQDIRELMVPAGFQEVFVGIESTDPEVLAGMNKSQNRGDLGRKVAILQNAGLEVTAGFIIGSDGDRPDVGDRLFRFIQGNGIVMPMPGLLTALRGTALYRRLAAEGRLRGESHGNNTHGFRFNFEPKLDEKMLIKGYVRLLERLFSSRNYYERCRILRQRRGDYHRLDRLNRHGVLATMRIFYHNLFKCPDWEFAKFVFDTLLESPKEFPEMITQAVKLAHFQEITKAAVAVHRYPEQVATLAERFQKRAAELRGDVDKRLRRLAKLERQISAEATRRWRSIDRDFRASVQGVLDRFRQHLAECAQTYRQAWQGRTLTH